MRTSAVLILGLALLTGLAAWKLCYVKAPSAMAALPQKWEQVYSLDPDETVRFVAPPFPPGRKQRISWAEKQVGLAVYGNGQVYTISRVSNPRENVIHEGYPQWTSFCGNHLPLWEFEPLSFGDVQAGMEFCALGKFPDIVVPAELELSPADGDWIVRGDAPLDQRLQAGRSILSAITGKNLRIRYAPVEREVDEYWSLCLDNQAPLRIIRETRSVPAVYLLVAATSEKP